MLQRCGACCKNTGSNYQGTRYTIKRKGTLSCNTCVSGRALRSAVERGGSVHEAAMKSTRTEAVGGLADRSSTENLLQEKAKADASVAEQKAAVAQKELTQIEKADKKAEQEEEAIEQRRISKEEEEMKRQKQLTDALIAEEQKLSDALNEEVAAIEKEVGATEADQKAADTHLDATLSEVKGVETHEQATKNVEEAEHQAEIEKADLETEEATNVAEIARHLTDASASKLKDVADSLESTEVKEEHETIGEAEGKVLSDVQKSEEEEREAFAEAETDESDEKEKGAISETLKPNLVSEEKNKKFTGQHEDDAASFSIKTTSGAKPSHLRTRRRKYQISDKHDESFEELKPTEFPVHKSKAVATEPRDAEPQVEGELEELADSWFGNRGSDEEETRTPNEGRKKGMKLAWWQHIFG